MKGGDGIHNLHRVRQNTPSSFAKMLAAELEYDNPDYPNGPSELPRDAPWRDPVLLR